MADDLQLWMPVVLEQPIEDWRVALELQPRVADNIRRLSVVRVRPSVTYDVNKRLSLTAGYFWSPVFDEQDIGGPVQFENRVWEQAMINHNLRRTKVSHQFRLEQRFLGDSREISVRARYLLRSVSPLGKTPWSLVASNELLWNLNETRVLPVGFNQNRIFAGVRRHLKPGTFIETGYMLQWVNQPAPVRDNANHNIVLRLQATLPRWLDKADSDSKAPKKPPRELKTPLILD